MEVEKSKKKKDRKDVKRLYKPPPEEDYTANYIRLIIVIVISVIFIGGEVVAGIIADSIAIISDAVHLVSDLIAFIFSFLFLYLSKKPPTPKMTFGFHRMELLGALANIFIIWFLIIFVMYESTLRIIDKDFVQKPFVMLIAAGAGFLVNVLMYKILHGGASHSHGLLSEPCDGHDHAHGHGHDHAHGHDHGHGHSHEHKHEHQHEHEHSPGHAHEHHSHSPGHKAVNDSGRSKEKVNDQIKPEDLGRHSHPVQYEEEICNDKVCNQKGPGVHFHDPAAPKPKSRGSGQAQSGQLPLLAERQDQDEESGYCQQEHEHKKTCYLMPQKRVTICQVCSGINVPESYDFKTRKAVQSTPDKGKLPDRHTHNHERSSGSPSKVVDEEAKKRMQSIGMQAAILHALSDMIMSLGLIISSLVIFFVGNPGDSYMDDVTQYNHWHLFDPIATYIFSVVSLASTLPVIKNSYNLMMESTPSYIDIEQLQRQFQEVEGVIDVHDIHVWDLKPGKTMVIAHVLAKTNTERQVLIGLSDIAREKKIYHSTFQIEEEARKDEPDYILCHHDIH